MQTSLMQFITTYSLLSHFLFAIAGLVIGSFINVVIYRLPLMITGQTGHNSQFFNLFLPRSHCFSCQHPLRLLDNIPLISFILLKGRCRYCGTKISVQYPLIELGCAVIAWLAFWYYGFCLELFATLSFIWMLLVLCVIDFRHKLLPDLVTLPLLWLGLLININGTFAPLDSAVMGAIFGYLALWVVYHLFRLVTGKEGMGYGDFKLLAALGAWCGWEALPAIILLASFTGSIAGLVFITLFRHNRHIPMAFGPWLALAGLVVFFLGDYLRALWFSFWGIPLIGHV